MKKVLFALMQGSVSAYIVSFASLFFGGASIITGVNNFVIFFGIYSLISYFFIFKNKNDYLFSETRLFLMVFSVVYMGIIGLITFFKLSDFNLAVRINQTAIIVFILLIIITNLLLKSYKEKNVKLLNHFMDSSYYLFWMAIIYSFYYLVFVIVFFARWG